MTRLFGKPAGSNEAFCSKHFLVKMCSTLLIAVLTTAALSPAILGKKPNDPPPADPPPVQYRLAYLDNIWGTGWRMRARSMNDSATIVGEVSGPDLEMDFTVFMAVPDGLGGMLTLDLNSLGAVWTDLDAGSPTTDWVARLAFGVNESDQIVGAAVHIVTGEYRTYVFEQDSNGNPRFTLMPREVGNHSVGRSINDLGVVTASAGGIVVYTPWTGYAPMYVGSGGSGAINNTGIIVTNTGDVISPANYYSDGTYDYALGNVASFSDRRLWDINNAGIVCGDRVETTSGRGKRKTVVQEGGPIKWDLVTNNESLLVHSPGDRAEAINDQGDILVWLNGSNGDDLVYTDAHGMLNLRDLIVNQDAVWLSDDYRHPKDITNSNAITDPHVTGFGMICGYLGFEGSAFVLTPEPYVSP